LGEEDAKHRSHNRMLSPCSQGFAGQERIQARGERGADDQEGKDGYKILRNRVQETQIARAMVRMIIFAVVMSIMSVIVTMVVSTAIFVVERGRLLAVLNPKVFLKDFLWTSARQAPAQVYNQDQAERQP